MTLQRKDIDVNATTIDGVNHAVPIGYAATPLALKIAFQGFGLAKSGERVQLNILQQLGNAFQVHSGTDPIV